MDIIGSIGKQKLEIKRIISDIREVQKAINMTSETLARTEALADEVLFQAAKGKATAITTKGGKNDFDKIHTDPAYVNSYRKLTALRDTFNKLVDCVANTGKADNNARDFEGKTEVLLARISGQNVDRMVKDLEEVRAENKKIVSAIKGK